MKRLLIFFLAFLCLAAFLFSAAACMPEETPEQPDNTQTPGDDTPDTPDTPDQPDTPDTPDTPDQPDTPDTPDERDETLLYLGEDGEFRYRFATASGIQIGGVSAVNGLISQLKKLGFQTARADADSLAQYDLEIIVGAGSVREGCSVDAHDLGNDGWRVFVSGERIVIAGGTDESTVKAFETFVSALHLEKGMEEITLPRDFYAENVPSYALSDVKFAGRKIGNYTVLADPDDQEAYAAASDFRLRLYNETGIWLELKPLDAAAEHPFVFRTAADAGEQGFRFCVSEDSAALECAYRNLFDMRYQEFANDFFAKTGVAEYPEGFCENRRANILYYSDFGAVGDGKAEDYDAICKTHEIANLGGQKVMADPGATYYIGVQTQTATIRTDVDWGNATFIIDDIVLPFESRNYHLFTIARDYSYQKLTAADYGTDFSLKKGQTNLGLTFDYDCMIVTNWAGHKVYNRYGVNANGGSSQREVLMVDREGNIDPSTPILWDYGGMDNLEVYRIDEKPLTIEGGIFITWANAQPCRSTYYARNLFVHRSNTTVRGVTHYVEKERDTGAPYTGFFYAQSSVNVLFENDVMSGHKTYRNIDKPADQGTYDTGSGYCNRVTWKGCTQVNSITDSKLWGVHASNFCKNLSMIDCRLSRFDAHQGMYNATVINTTLGRFLNCIGGGLLYCENVTRIGTTFASLRSDYGSTWEGDAVFKNCTLQTSSSSNAYLFSGSYIANWDFGYTCYMPQNVTLENFTYTGKGKMYVFWNVPATAATDPVNPYQITKSVTFVGMSALPLAPNTAAFGDTTVTVKK